MKDPLKAQQAHNTLENLRGMNRRELLKGGGALMLTSASLAHVSRGAAATSTPGTALPEDGIPVSTDLAHWVRTDTTVTAVDFSAIPDYIPESHAENLMRYHPRVNDAMVSSEIVTNDAGLEVLKFKFPDNPVGWWDNTVDLLSTLEFAPAPKDVPILVARNADGSPMGSIDFGWSLLYASISGTDSTAATTLQWRHRSIGEVVTTKWRWHGIG
ncbi:MAG: hypothetical protein AAF933_12320 [Pseudomonadota bacterium]